MISSYSAISVALRCGRVSMYPHICSCACLCVRWVYHLCCWLCAYRCTPICCAMWCYWLLVDAIYHVQPVQCTIYVYIVGCTIDHPVQPSLCICHHILVTLLLPVCYAHLCSCYYVMHRACHICSSLPPPVAVVSVTALISVGICISVPLYTSIIPHQGVLCQGV